MTGRRGGGEDSIYVGTRLDAADVRRSLRTICGRAEAMDKIFANEH